MASAVRLLIVEDHAAAGVGLRLRLARDHRVQVVGQATDVRTAARLAIELRPDVVLIDLDELAWHCPLVRLTAMRAAVPESVCVALTLHDSPATRGQALAAGAVAVVGKQEPTEVLLAAIRAAAHGG